jgi:2,3-bisphosphoglycerate-dependent phosphoglycerate mutase
MVYERVQPFYVSTIVPLLKGGQNILLVAHGNSIRALIKYIESVDDEAIGDIEMLFGDLLVYEIDDNGCMRTKNTTHIDSPAPNA